MAVLRHVFRLAIFAGPAGLLSGCLGLEAGFSGRDAELARRGEFYVERASHEEAVVLARGRRVTLAPIEGLCLASDVIETSPEGAFAVVGDCLTEAPPGPRTLTADGRALANLPPAFSGLVTLSVSGEPMFASAAARQPRALDGLVAFLATPSGHALLGRGGDPETVEVIEAKAVGDALYVHVHDTDETTLALLAPDFWRAFVEINGRLVLVTVSGFRDRPLPPETMLTLLAGQLTALRAANAAAPVADEVVLASGTRVRRRDAGSVPTDPRPAREGGLSPVVVSGIPVPPARPVKAAEAGPGAPAIAPRAPPRPRRG